MSGFLDGLGKWLGLNSQPLETASSLFEAKARGIPLPPSTESLFSPPPDTRHIPPEYVPSSHTPPRPGEFFFGGQNYPLDALRSTLFLGQSGAGKSHTLMIMTRNIADAVRVTPDARLFIVASKEDAAETLTAAHIPFTTLDITDRNSPYWDIASDFSSPNEFLTFAKILIPTEEKNPFWSKAAQMLLCGVMTSYHYRLGASWRFSDAILGVLSPLKTLEKILALCPANETILDTTFRDVQVAGETRSNIRIDLLARLSGTFPLAVHCQEATRPFSLRRFLTPGIPVEERIVILTPDLRARDATLPVAHGVVSRLTDLVSALPDSTGENSMRKVVLTLDEAQFLKKITSISSFTAFTRSKGGALLFSSQTIDGLYHEYGQHDAESILGNFPFMVMFRQGTPVSAKWCIQKLGSLAVWEERPGINLSSSGFSQSQSWGWVTRPRIVDSDVLYLPLASPSVGVHGYYVVPYGEGYEIFKYVIPPSVVDSLHPRTHALATRKAHVSGYLRPWKSAEMERFLCANDRERARFRELLREEVLHAIVNELRATFPRRYTE